MLAIVMRFLVTGTLETPPESVLRAALLASHDFAEGSPVTLVHRRMPGLELAAAAMAASMGWNVLVYRTGFRTALTRCDAVVGFPSRPRGQGSAAVWARVDDAYARGVPTSVLDPDRGVLCPPS